MACKCSSKNKCCKGCRCKEENLFDPNTDESLVECDCESKKLLEEED